MGGPSSRHQPLFPASLAPQMPRVLGFLWQHRSQEHQEVGDRDGCVGDACWPGTGQEGWEPVLGMAGHGVLPGAAWGWRGAVGKDGERWERQCPSFPSDSLSLLGGGGRGRRQSPGVGSLAVVETNATNLSLFYHSLYDGTHGRDSRSCESQTFMVDFFTLVWWGVWLCGLLGNMVVVQFLGFHMKKSPFTVYILNLAIVTSL